MALRRLSSSHLPQLRPAAARSLATAPFLHDTDDLPRSRDRETADEETFERPFYCIKSNVLPPWPRKTGQSETALAFLHRGSTCKMSTALVPSRYSATCTTLHVLHEEHAHNNHPTNTGMTEVRGPFSDIMGKRRLWVRHLPAHAASNGFRMLIGGKLITIHSLQAL
jgi:hypothetical protein